MKKTQALFLLLLISLLGLFITSDYGIGTDESAQRDMGLTSYNYVVHGDKTLHQFFDRHHGMAFEVLLVIPEKVFGMTDMATIYLMRHFMTGLFFMFSLYIAFLLFVRLGFSNNWAFLGTLFILIQPRIFGDIFHNSKDTICLSFFIISSYSGIRFWQNKTFWNLLLHALCCALLINVRLTGMLMFGATGLLFLAEFFFKKEKAQIIKNLLIYTFSSLLFLYLSWPYLWETPIESFTYIFKSMKNYPQDLPMLLNGKLIFSHKLQPDYLPVWIFVTTPILLLISLLIGCYFFIQKNIFKNTIRDAKSIYFYVSLFIIVGTFVPLWLFHSVLYDAWRHVFYLALTIAFIALYGLEILYKKLEDYKILQKTFIGIISMNIAYIIFQLIQLHPYQNVYFNGFVSKQPESVRYNWDEDYWCLSCIEGAEFILEKEKENKDTIFVFPANGVISDCRWLLTEEERNSKLLFSKDTSKTTYTITNYRYNPYYDTVKTQEQEVFFIERNNSRVLSVFKKK